MTPGSALPRRPRHSCSGCSAPWIAPRVSSVLVSRTTRHGAPCQGYQRGSLLEQLRRRLPCSQTLRDREKSQNRSHAALLAPRWPRLLAHHQRLLCLSGNEVTHMLWLFRRSTRVMLPRPGSSQMLSASRTELLRAHSGHGQPSSLDHQRGPRRERRLHRTLRKLARLTPVAQRARLPAAVLTTPNGRG